MLVSRACLAINIDICRKCIGKMPPSGGMMTCPVDGAPVATHATTGECPKRLYGASIKLADVAHGAAGLVKVMIGRDKASPELVAQRQAICEGCEHRVMRLGVFHQCDICKCATAAKIRLKGEKCPVGKW
jgi:hypothetical protein